MMAQRPSRASSDRSFRSTLLKTYLGQVVYAATLFVGTLLTARLLGPSGRGELAILILVPTLLIVASEFGQGFTVSHLVAARPARAAALNANALAFSAALLVPSVAICAGCFRVFLGADTHYWVNGGAAGVAVSAGI